MSENIEQIVDVTKKDTDKYDLTVLLAFFMGALGIHRIINGKKGTGYTMLNMTIFANLLLLIPVVGWAISFLLFIAVNIWSLVDVILIITNNFKNGAGQVVGYDGKFFSSKSNIVIPIMFVVVIVAIIFSTTMFLALLEVIVG